MLVEGQARRAGQKLCALEPQRAGGCLVWEQRKLEATPGNETSVQARLGQQKSPLEEQAERVGHLEG